MLPTGSYINSRLSAQVFGANCWRLASTAALCLPFFAGIAADEELPLDEGNQEPGKSRITIRLKLQTATSAAIQTKPLANSEPAAFQADGKPTTSPSSAAKSLETIQCQFDGPLKLTDSSGPKKIPADSTATQLSTKQSSRDQAPKNKTENEELSFGGLPSAKNTGKQTQTKISDDLPTELRLAKRDQELEQPNALRLEPAVADDSQVQGKDGSKECPGSPESDIPEQEPQPDDIPLEQDEHPYDAPAAKSSDSSETLAPVASLFTPREQRIRADIQRCLHYYLTHPENTTRRGPWALMHAALPFGVEADIVAGNRNVNALGWMCFNGVCAKQRMFQPTRQSFRTNVGPGVQGHEGQFLAILAQSRVQPDYPLQIGNRQYTVMDLARYEMATCREKSELTFKLIGLSHYLDQNQRWRDSRGQTWNLEKMVAEELAQPVVGAACGGSHRLMGLSYAVIKRQSAGLPVNGHWYRAERYLNDYVNYAMSLQNPDGSFSTNWFESRGMDSDVEQKVKTTGHILEWLIFTLPDDHLRSPRVQDGIEYLLETVGRNPERDWPIGPRGHALRAMALYSQRVFGARPGQLEAFVAEAPVTSNRR